METTGMTPSPSKGMPIPEELSAEFDITVDLAKRILAYCHFPSPPSKVEGMPTREDAMEVPKVIYHNDLNHLWTKTKDYPHCVPYYREGEPSTPGVERLREKELLKFVDFTTQWLRNTYNSGANWPPTPEKIVMAFLARPAEGKEKL